MIDTSKAKGREHLLPSRIEFVQFAFGFALGSILFLTYANQVTAGFSAFPGGLTDARFNNAVLEHLYFWMSGNAEDLWRPDFFFPYPDVLAFSDNHFGSGLVYVMARFMGVEKEVAYTVWYLFGTVLTFACTWWVLLKFRFSPAAAAIGAAIFAFAGTILFRTEHSQLIYRFATPLAFWYAWHFLQTARLKALGLLAFFVSWQFLCSVYLGVFLLLFFMGACAGLLLFRETRQKLLSLPRRIYEERPSPADVFWMVLGGLLTALTLYVLAKYALVARMYGFSRDPGIIFAQQPLWGSYLVMDYTPYYAWMGRWVQDDFLRHEKQMFMGGVATLLMLMALLPGKVTALQRLPAKVLLVALAFLILITLRFPSGFTFYWPFAHAPGFSSIRAVGRVVEVMLLPVAFLAAIGFEKLCSLSPFYKRVVGGLISVLIGAALVMEVRTLHYHNTPFETLYARQDAIRQLVPGDLPQDAILVYRERPDENQYVMTDVDAIMLAQQVKRPVLNGYSGNFPSGYRALRSCGDIVMPIAGAAAFNRMRAEEADAILARVVPVDFPGCGDLSVYGHGFVYQNPLDPLSSVPIPFDLAAGIGLSVASLDVAEGGILVRAVVRNNGNDRLPGNFASGAHNIRFSWRFRPMTEGLSFDDGWNERAQLTSSVEPGAEVSEMILVTPPQAPGEYLLEMSMVQEQVMWLHDHGLEIASAPMTIRVESNGASGGQYSLGALSASD